MPGIEGVPHAFAHAWFQTWVMFSGEALCLAAFAVLRLIRPPTDAEKASEARSPICSALFVLPTVCDLAGTTLGGLGLLYTSASVWQMLRGSIIVFSGVLSVLMLGRRLHTHHWIGMGVLCAGLALVGAADLLSSREEHAALGVGVTCILLGQLASSLQMVVEELLLKKRGYAPLAVVGMEGLVGVVGSGLLVLPLLRLVPLPSPSDGTLHRLLLVSIRDDAVDAVVQASHSPLLVAMLVLYLGSIAMYNFCGLSVTRRLTAVHRTLIDACRTLVVWCAELALAYAGAPQYGETWSDPFYWSMLQLGGFGLLLLGTALYNAVLRLPFSVYEDTPKQTEGEVRPLMHSVSDHEDI